MGMVPAQPDPLKEALVCGLDPERLAIFVKLYVAQVWPADWLPYTDEFESMLGRLHSAGILLDRRTFARKLIALRKHKSKPLPRKGRSGGSPSPFTRTQEGHLIVLYGHQGLPSDRLPYTLEFDRLAAEFRSQTRRNWTDLEIFHGILGLRKAGRLPRKGRGVTPLLFD